jgi:hypothetical protein
LPARHQLGPLVKTGLDVGQDTLVVVRVDERAHLGGRVGRRADPDAFGPVGEPADQGVIDRPFGQNP